MDRRKFLVSSGIVGAGLLGGGAAAPGIFANDPGRSQNPISKWRINPWHLLCPPCRTRSTR